MKVSRVLFVTGTDTAVGKTVLSALLVRHLLGHGVQAAAFKPVASGDRGDARMLHAAQRGRLALDVINPWHYRAPLAPALAARMQRSPLQLGQVVNYLRSCKDRAPILIVEGAGGLLSPLGEGFDSRDLIHALRAVPLIVSPNRLGAINQVRVTLAALPAATRRRAVVVLSAPEHRDASSLRNRALLQEWEPGVAVFDLPRCARWRDPTAALSVGARRCLDSIAQVILGKPTAFAAFGRPA